MRTGLKLVFLVGLVLLIPSFLAAQIKIWVATKDTASYDVKTQFCSQWLDLCSCTTDAITADRLITQNNAFPIPIYQLSAADLSAESLGFALEQIEAEILINKGLTGKGVKIGIIDGGFLGADEKASLENHFEHGRVAFYKDYITPNLGEFKGSKGLDDAHGTDVWNLIGGWNPETNVIYGLATDATYYLARTDHGGYERRIEEDLLIEALEEMQRMGVRLVNVSLGYADGYTRKSENYTPAMMDGKSSMLTRAVDSAFYSKNMLVVVSAGNEGSRNWKVLSAPADAKGALSVGASLLNHWDKMKYSSIGTPGLGYIKPEVMCFASNGTSFSAPIITGLAASILQYDSTLSASEIKDLIIKSASQYPYGNNYTGYGVPLASRLIQLFENQPLESLVVKVIAKRKYLIQFNAEQIHLSVLHKNSFNEVIKYKTMTKDKKRIKIKQETGAIQTTLIQGNKTTEIIWTN